jgi:DNA-binding transcriptional MerR regulator
MHPIKELRQILGLTSTNQVRNRIEAVRDLLFGEIRRGPNNQILLTDAGLELLRRLQELYDSGLTIVEASQVLRANTYKKDIPETSVLQRSSTIDIKQDQAALLLSGLREEISSLRARVGELETRLLSQPDPPGSRPVWWAALREEIDAT